MPRRSIAYIDGFNLYYGLLRGSRLKWLDVQRVFETLTPTYELQKVYLFTARLRNTSRARRERQQTYLDALRTRPLVEVIEGKFKMTDVTCNVRSCRYRGDREFQKPEEKRRDVNIAVQMMRDAYENNGDVFFLVSGDSDLVPPINTILRVFPDKHIRVYVPTQYTSARSATEIRQAATTNRTLSRRMLRGCSLPETITDPHGNIIVRPEEW